MRAAPRTAWPLAALAAVVCGCVLGPKLETPKLSIAAVQVLSGELWEQHVKVRLRVHNPNDRALPVKGLEYTVEIAGEQFASGSSAESFVIPALGDAEFDTNATANVAGALLKLLGRGPNAAAEGVQYRLSGKFWLAEGLWRSISFDERGSFKP